MAGQETLPPPQIKIKILPHAKDLPFPSYSSPHHSGFSLLAANPGKRVVEIKPFEKKILRTGLIVKIPVGYEGDVRPTHGFCHENGLVILEMPINISSHVEDEKEIEICVINLSSIIVNIPYGVEIGQFSIYPIYQGKLVKWNE